MTAISKPIDASLVEAVIVKGDLAGLTPDQRVAYYVRVCETVGLNPLTRPLEYVTFQGRTVLYARRDCADQLRRMHGVSVTIVGRERVDDLQIVTAQARLPDGRVDESTGAVSVAGLKGEALANALMKAETKAKRRVTLSICGLGMLDESEVEPDSGVTPHHAFDEDAAKAAKADDDRMAEEWGQMVDGLEDADALARWCHHHGYLLHGLHSTAKARLWRRMVAAAGRLMVQQMDMREWLAQSQQPIDVESEHE